MGMLPPWDKDTMSIVEESIFKRLRVKKEPDYNRGVTDNPVFQIGFDGEGAHVRIVDNGGNEIEPDGRYYHGALRDLLNRFSNIRDRNSFRIDWESPSERIHIGLHPGLAQQLCESCRIVDEMMRPVTMAESEACMTLCLTTSGTKVHGRFTCFQEDKSIESFRLIDDRHILSDGVIFPIPPLGERFRELLHFETAVAPANLSRYLSLFFSAFNTVTVRYGDYRTRRGKRAFATPTLIFEDVDRDRALHLRVAAALPGFDADFLADYGILQTVTFADEAREIVVRELVYGDVAAGVREIEKLLKRTAGKSKEKKWFAEGTRFIIGESLAARFICQELGHLISRYDIMGVERLKSYKIRSDTPKLALNLASGIDFLAGEGSLEFAGSSIGLSEALDQYSKKSYISLADGSSAILDKGYMEKLARLFKGDKERVSVSFFDLPEVEKLMDERTAASQKCFKHSREVFAGFSRIAKSRPALPKLSVKMRGYQKQGYKWARYLGKHGLGGCLADDMGLGKTLQAIAVLAAAYPKQRKCSLVVMPKSLLFNWEAELTRFCPELTFYTWYKGARKMGEAKKHHLILTTYAMVRGDISTFMAEDFHYVILDESQHIKNLNSKTSRSVMLLKAECRLALSGTPVENSLAELYALFSFLNPAMFGSPTDFNRNYLIPIQRDENPSALGELKRKIYPFILRRLKKEVAKEMPEKVSQVLYVSMEAEQKKLYERRQAFFQESLGAQIRAKGIAKSQFSILQALGELRQIASVPEAKSGGAVISPKREILMQHIRDLAESGHKILVFANYLDALEGIATDLSASGIDYLQMTGATGDRQKLVERFQGEAHLKVFLMTLKTGGVGLNLTAADYVFLYDPWWNRAAENQAVDRTHRIGQEKKVFSYRLITKGTIEERILQLQEKKSALFENLIASDGASIKSMTEEDVRFILGS